MVAPASEVVRVVGRLASLARRADARLAHGAARNAAACVRDQRARRLDDAQLLHDLPTTSAEAAPRRTRTSG